MLGLTVSVRGLTHGTGWLIGLGIAVLLAVLVRPVLVGLLLLPISLNRGERVFVVAFSVIVQAALVLAVARRAWVPMLVLEPELWALGTRFRNEPTGLRRFQVTAGAPADGCTIANLALDEETWISMINRDGELIPVRGGTVYVPVTRSCCSATQTAPSTRPRCSPRQQ